MARGRRKKAAAAADTPAAQALPPATPSPAPAPRRRGASTSRPTLVFKDRLVLNQWILSLFGVGSFEDLAGPLRSESLEGLDENNVHRFNTALVAHFPDLPALPPARLLAYDQAIVSHTLRLNAARITRGEEPIRWKYFQYLTLLFTEIYLDHYFTDAKALLSTLNGWIAAFNEGKGDADRVKSLDAAADAWPQLNKLAFWMATGAGKTLVMHANILQYQHHLEKAGRRRELNRIILLTPNEGLSDQHLREFHAAGIDAEVFDKDGRGLFAGKSVEILEVTRLKDEAKDKTVAVDAFEGNNLVLVDEGHRGTSSGDEGAWMKNRNALCEKGFSFEYSATFGQAVNNNASLSDQYAKNTLVDYSYRWFYDDGFGKDYQILNLDEVTQREHLDLYLVGALLSFFQQLRLFREHGTEFRPFQIEKPLWVFVGGSVTATLGRTDASDIVEICRFLAHYAGDRAGSIALINRLLSQGLETAAGRDLFARRFEYLNTSGLSPGQIYDESLAVLFNAPGGGQLFLEDLKGASGEIALRLGADNAPFGVINVGDSRGLLGLCRDRGLTTGDAEFKGSLFQAINTPASTVNVLIGSKKFTEGWSSWRVSTMGLMNVGRSEGAQIIQLFGRGVRLKGYGMCLKRSAAADLPAGVTRPRHIGILETLGIFGIRADYMAQFREFLEAEGLKSDKDRVEFLLPVLRNLGLLRLRTIRLKKTIDGVTTEFGTAFRQLAPVPTLAASADELKWIRKHPVVANWYPKIQATKSTELVGGDAETSPNISHLSKQHLAFLDFGTLWFEVERYKAERGWFNLNIPRNSLRNLLEDPSWYRLQIPEADLAIDSYERVRLWQQIAEALLKEYVKRAYSYHKQAWEMPHLEYRDLDVADANFLPDRDDPSKSYHRIMLDRSETEIASKLNELKEAIEKGEMKPIEFKGLKAIWCGNHLYGPLLHLSSKSSIEISPAPLNKSELRFVEDLKAFHDANPEFFKERQLYLLRNLSRGRGVGFFEAGNFHPDFLVWVVEGDTQRVIFVDPKGIRHVAASDPKIEFHKTIKRIESQLGDPKVTLSSFIVSNTPSHEMHRMWGKTKSEMQAQNIVFQEEDRDAYIANILHKP